LRHIIPCLCPGIWRNNISHIHHGLEGMIELDWKIMIRAPHHPYVRALGGIT